MLKLWELAPSPFNLKARLALRHKSIPFEVVAVDPMQRQAVIDLSGQELTPVIEDRGLVINDSEAIVQYLDANYRQTPRLYPADRAGRKQCEDWKTLLDEKLVKHWAPVFMHVIGFRPEPDDAARRAYLENLAWLDAEIGDKDSVFGQDKAIADILAVVWSCYALPPAGLLKRAPIFGKVQKTFGADPERLPHLRRFLGLWEAKLS